MHPDYAFEDILVSFQKKDILFLSSGYKFLCIEV